jgi:hypothetical protein
VKSNGLALFFQIKVLSLGSEVFGLNQLALFSSAAKRTKSLVFTCQIIAYVYFIYINIGFVLHFLQNQTLSISLGFRYSDLVFPAEGWHIGFVFSIYFYRGVREVRRENLPSLSFPHRATSHECRATCALGIYAEGTIIDFLLSRF